MTNGTRWLVTGATGFLGAHLVRAGLAAGAEVHVVVRPTSARSRLAGLRDVIWHQADLTNLDEARRAVSCARADLVVHLAMPGGHPDTPASRSVMATGAVIGTLNLLEALADHSPRRLLHAGSGLEYGPGEAARESQPLLPSVFRGAVKAATSLLVQQWALANDWPTTVLRIFSVYGPWEPPGRLVPTAIRSALTGTPMPLTPGAWRDHVYVSDVINACMRASALDAPGVSVFNVGSGTAISNEAVVRAVEHVTGRPVPVLSKAAPPRVCDRATAVADTAAAASGLGWRATTSLHDGLAKSLRWFDAHPHAW